MIKRTHLSIPTNGALPDAHRLSTSNNDVHKALSRLSRASLLRLALQWLESSNVSRCAPFLTANETEDDVEADDAPWLAAQSVEELREAYKEQQLGKGGKREVIDRILEGDWRHGISLYQLAMADTMYLKERSASQKWHALRLVRMQDEGEDVEREDQDKMPRFQKHAFLQSLQREIGPLVKAHYYLTREEEKTYTLLRIYLFDLPYNTQRALTSASLLKGGATEATKSIFLVFPDATPFFYVSIPTHLATPAASESRSLQKMIIDAIPKALSRPQARYAFQTTALSARTLPALLALRGSGRTNAAAGGWGIFVDDVQGQSALACAETLKRSLHTMDYGNEVSALGARRPCDETCMDAQEAKRRKAVAEGRFGCSGVEADGMGIERFEVRIDDLFPKVTTEPADDLLHVNQWRANGKENQHELSQSKHSKSGRKPRPSLLDMAVVRGNEPAESAVAWRPDIRLSLQGSHVFAGIRQLVEKGVVDGERMPGWMTGEAGVSIGVVRHGRLMARADAGL